jgi:hypothetical protein
MAKIRKHFGEAGSLLNKDGSKETLYEILVGIRNDLANLRPSAPTNPAVADAPAAYDQAWEQTIVNLINELRQAISTLAALTLETEVE